jgi:Na+-transporting NADH:ubiquinone oxidoreductase subunit F
MLEIALGVGFFTAIVVALAGVILVVRAGLVPSGRVAIVVNEGRTVEAPVGVKLLQALGDAGIHLPSACGGVGTCGQCRVAVLEGGGALLPIEKGRISKREAAAGLRLACQVTVKEDLRVEVPDEIFGVQHWQCTVRSSRTIATLIKELVLDLPPGETIDFRAGSYVQITCPPYRAKFADFVIGDEFRGEWNRFDLWRYEAGTSKSETRAYSLANGPDERDHVRLVVRIAIPPPGAPGGVPPGVVSSYIFGLAPGDNVTVSGPYGHFFAIDSRAEMVFVGGGAGIAPMRAHILDQLGRLKSGRKITFWYGARNRRELLYADEFDRLQGAHDNFEWAVALSEPRPEDHWQGPTGFIHQVLQDRYLAQHPAPEECEYYLCGPPLMIKAVRNMLDSLGVDPENIFFDDFGG